ncbi:MAG: NADP(H)-dependent aldo-keto reductase, partial [Gammaproteobacteria bacterium]|nr:NADP(H)-dependent aldo-keto reductase [Gammaproteobacteria bacterium]
NFFDTAELYPVPPKAETYTATETIIGNWFEQRKNRDKVILASKVAGPGEWVDYMRDGKMCLDRKNINAAIEGSLKRLKTDYIDLYQLHWPDRQTNFFGQLGYQHNPVDNSVPIEETLDILDELVKSGKVRHIGLSNETPWGTMQFVHKAETKNQARIVSIQNPYNLLNRSFEVGLAEIAHRESVGLLAYSPMAFGALSGKYINNQKPEGARLTLFERFDRYSNPQALAAIEAYVTLARKHGLDPAQMALAYVNSRSFLTSNIIGATNLVQLKSNLESIELKLSEEVLDDIDAIHTRQPNPSP